MIHSSIQKYDAYVSMITKNEIHLSKIILAHFWALYLYLWLFTYIFIVMLFILFSHLVNASKDFQLKM